MPTNLFSQLVIPQRWVHPGWPGSQDLLQVVEGVEMRQGVRLELLPLLMLLHRHQHLTVQCHSFWHLHSRTQTYRHRGTQMVTPTQTHIATKTHKRTHTVTYADFHIFLNYFGLNKQAFHFETRNMAGLRYNSMKNETQIT